MDSKLKAGLALLLVVGAAVASAVVLTGEPRQVALTDNPSDADHVTLYQSGLAFVRLTREFNATQGDTLLTFSVPTTAILDSLRVEGDGIVVKEVRSTLSRSPAIQPGDEVIVHVTDGQTFRGRVIEWEDRQLISAGNRTIAISPGEIKAIEVLGRQAAGAKPGSAEVTVRVDAREGPSQVRMSYLAQGAAWAPVYTLDTKTGAFSFYAALTGLEDWKNVKLDLVAGSPSLVYTPIRRGGMEMYSVAAKSPAGMADDGGFGGSTELGELHRYSLARPINFTRGETVRLPVLTSTIEIARDYYAVDAGLGFSSLAGARQDPRVIQKFELRNNLSDFLPSGIVRLYRDGAWIGEDQLQATPAGERTNVTAAMAENVKARLVLKDYQGGRDKDVSTYELVVENFKKQPIDLRASLTHPSYRTSLVSATPQPSEKEGATLIWNMQVPAGAKATFRLTYETIHEQPRYR